MKNWYDAERVWNDRKKRPVKLANSTYLENPNPELTEFVVTLHGNPIIMYRPGRYTLNSCGWETKTTKDRLNKFTPFTIFSQRREWFIQYKHGTGVIRTEKFRDGMTFYEEDLGYIFEGVDDE